MFLSLHNHVILYFIKQKPVEMWQNVKEVHGTQILQDAVENLIKKKYFKLH